MPNLIIQIQIYPLQISVDCSSPCNRTKISAGVQLALATMSLIEYHEYKTAEVEAPVTEWAS